MIQSPSRRPQQAYCCPQRRLGRACACGLSHRTTCDRRRPHSGWTAARNPWASIRRSGPAGPQSPVVGPGVAASAPVIDSSSAGRRPAAKRGQPSRTLLKPGRAPDQNDRIAWRRPACHQVAPGDETYLRCVAIADHAWYDRGRKGPSAPIHVVIDITERIMLRAGDGIRTRDIRLGRTFGQRPSNLTALTGLSHRLRVCSSPAGLLSHSRQFCGQYARTDEQWQSPEGRPRLPVPL